MPPERLKLAHTIEFKIKMVEDFHLADPPQNRVQFCRERTFSRSTHQLWDTQLDAMRRAVADKKRAKCLTMGGSGRVSPPHVVEDAICIWIKDERREERAVSMETIIAHCMALLPDFMEPKSHDARRSWCTRFMKRSGLAIRKITYSGRKKHPQLLALKEEFACEVGTILIDHFIDAEFSTPPPIVLFNMDQTAVYCDLGETTTVDFIGVGRVPVNGGGKGSYRCTVALLARGCQGVYAEVLTFCDHETATFSVQTNAWFDERVMLEWIDEVWQYVATGPTVLILDCLKTHKCDSVRRRFAEMGTYPVYVPGGCTSVSQPLDVGIMAPFKKVLKSRYTELYSTAPPPSATGERRYDMFQRSMFALGKIKPDTVTKAFHKAGPFLPYGPLDASRIIEEAIV